GRQECRNGSGGSARPRQQLHRPLRYTPLLDVDVLAVLRLVDVLLLEYERQRLLGTRGTGRKLSRFLVTAEGAVVVAAVAKVRRAASWIAPDAVFQHRIPDIAAARFGSGGIGA